MLTIQLPMRQPVVMRSQMMLEVASHLVAEPGWDQRQVLIHLRPQGGRQWNLRFFASDAPNSVDAVASGEADIAICNPGGVLAMAVRGAGPFKEPLPLRAIMVLPQFDQMGFAVSGKTGLKTLRDLKESKYPLKVSLRGQPDHSVHLVCSQVLAAYGMSFEDIVSWGGELRYTEGMPSGPERIEALGRGEIDAVWDEAMPTFANRTLELGGRFLAIDEPEMQKLEAMGLQRVGITKEEFPALPEDVWSVDFSGWPVFCLESAPDDMIAAFCAGLEARKDRIPWYGDGPMRLDEMVKGTREAPVTIPLHPAAERFWHERGYI